MSRENSFSSLSSLVSAASAAPTSFSGRRTSMPSASRKFQRRSPTIDDGLHLLADVRMLRQQIEEILRAGLGALADHERQRLNGPGV